MFSSSVPVRIFYESNTGANASGGTAAAGGAAGAGGNVTSQNPAGGAAATATTATAPATPPSVYDSIPWEELPPTVRTTLEAARADHQRLATERVTLETERNQERDGRLRLEQQQQQRQQQMADGRVIDRTPPSNPIVDKTREYLKAQGYTQQQIDAQAPILGGLLENVFPIFRESLGRDLQPLANSVVAHDNLNNFTSAQQDAAGSRLLADPDVAQEVWNLVQQQTAKGQTFGPDAILNLAKMVYVDRQFATAPAGTNGNPPTPVSPSAFFPTLAPAPISRSTGHNFPGANLRPIGTGATAPAGAQVNEDTRAALAQTFGEMARVTGVAPSAFPSNDATRGGGARRR